MFNGLTNRRPASGQVRKTSLGVTVDLATIDHKGLERFARVASSSPVDSIAVNLYGSFDVWASCDTPSGSPTLELLPSASASASVAGFVVHSSIQRPVTVSVCDGLRSFPDPLLRPAGPAGSVAVVSAASTLWYPLVSDGSGVLHPLQRPAGRVASQLWAACEEFRSRFHRSITVVCSKEVFDAVWVELGGVAPAPFSPLPQLSDRLLLAAGVLVMPAEIEEADLVLVMSVHGPMMQFEHFDKRAWVAPAGCDPLLYSALRADGLDAVSAADAAAVLMPPPPL